MEVGALLELCVYDSRREDIIIICACGGEDACDTMPFYDYQEHRLAVCRLCCIHFEYKRRKKNKKLYTCTRKFWLRPKNRT